MDSTWFRNFITVVSINLLGDALRDALGSKDETVGEGI